MLKKDPIPFERAGDDDSGVKKFLNKDKTLKLDETLNNSINAKLIKNKINNISDIVKSLKRLK